MTVPVFGGITTAGDSNGSTLTVSRATTTNGEVNAVDLYLEHLPASLTFSNGTWAVYGPINQTASTPDYSHWRAIEIYGGGGTTVVISWGGAAVWRSATCRRYTLVNTGTPVDATPTGQASAAASTTATAPSATIATADALALWAETDFEGRTVTGPSGFTERSDFANLQVSDRAYPSAGSTGVITASLNQAAENTGALLVLRPATPGGGSPINLTPGPMALSIGLPTVAVGMGSNLAPSALQLALTFPAVAVGLGAAITPTPLPVSISLPSVSVSVGGALLPSPLQLRLTFLAVAVAGGSVSGADAVDMQFYRYLADDGSVWAVKLDRTWGENPASGAEPYVPGTPVLTKRSSNQARRIVVQDFATGRWTRRVVCTPTAAAWTTPAWSDNLPVRGASGLVHMVKVEHIPERIHRPRAIHSKPAPETV